MHDVGRLLVVVGLTVAAVGLVLWLGPSLPYLGRLPGDVRIERPGLRFHFPLTTCFVLSAGVSMVLWALSRWR